MDAPPAPETLSEAPAVHPPSTAHLNGKKVEEKISISVEKRKMEIVTFVEPDEADEVVDEEVLEEPEPIPVHLTLPASLDLL